jgi:hypothetical protein
LGGGRSIIAFEVKIMDDGQNLQGLFGEAAIGVVEGG